MSAAIVIGLLLAWAIGFANGFWVRGQLAGTSHRPAVLVEALPRVELSGGAARSTRRRHRRNRADLRKVLAR